MGRYVSIVSGIGLIIILLAAAGCARLPASTVGELEKSERVVTLDCYSNQGVRINAVRTTRTDNNRLKVEVEILNKRHPKQMMRLQVKTTFKDRSGMLTEDSTPFEMVLVPMNSLVRYSAISVSEDAADFMVEIRKPPKSK